jgi:hypothetical protein
MKLPMKLLRIAGLCLVAMCAMSMVAAGTASATWEHCTKGPVNAAPTKYSEHGCSTLAQSTGEWNWREVNGTEEVRLKGSLKLTDTKVPIAGKVSVECSGEGVGSVGPGQLDRINEIKTSAAQCRKLENCEEVKVAEARNLPWQSEAYNTEGKHFDRLSGTGNGAPGWNVECKVLGVSKPDKCVQEEAKPEHIALENKSTVVGSETELLVLSTFSGKEKAECEVGGAKAGEVTGSLAMLQANGWGLKIS